MPVFVSLLRGVNVGGRHKIQMDTLRTLYETLGFENPQTYIQSGNVVFATRTRNPARLIPGIENAIQVTFGFRSAVILRTCEDLRGIVARNPFAAEPDMEGRKLLVTFFSSEPGDEVRRTLASAPVASERLHWDGRELYTYFPQGMGWSKLGASLMAVPLSTGRNWNTVCKLLAMAEAMERK